MKTLAILSFLIATFLPAQVQIGKNVQIGGTSSSGGAGVSSINGNPGSFTFSGSGVSCSFTTCTFSGGGPSGFPVTLGATPIAANSTTTSIFGLTVNGVALTATGSTSLFLNQAGSYTAPAGGGSGTVSGQASGVVGLGTGPTTTGSQSHINENTPGTTTVTQKLAVSSGGTDPSQLTLTYSGFAPVPAAGSAVYTVDSSGNAEVGENGAAVSRICTAGNGICASGASFPSAHGIVFSTSTTTSRVATGDTDYQSVLSTPPAAYLSPITVQANHVFDIANSVFTDGTPYINAGPAYVGLGMSLEDEIYTCMGNPSKCSAALLLNSVNKTVAHASGSNELPVNVVQNLSSAGFYSGWDSYHHYASGGGRIMVPEALYLYCQKVGVGSSACTSAYSANVAPIKAAWAATPRDATSHLYQIVPGDEYICGSLFMEYMRKTGFDTNCNVFAAIDDADMLALATAAGDASNVTFYTTDLAQLVAGIRANLINGSNGLLISASIQGAANDDIVSSSLAVACDSSPVMAPCGILTSGQKTTIETYFDTNYATLTNAAGFILETPQVGGWVSAPPGHIPVGGGPPYGSSAYSATQYEGGFLSWGFSWFAEALGQVDQTKVETLLNTFLNGVDPAAEWFDRGSGIGSGTTPNTVSPEGAVLANMLYPAPITLPTGNGCFNLYGAQVNTTCGTGTVSGSGTATHLPKWTSTTALGDSSIIETGSALTTTESFTSSNGINVLNASLGSGANTGFAMGISITPHNSAFNVWWNTAHPYGSFETYAAGDPINLGGSQVWLNGGPVFIGNANANGGATLPTATGLFNVGTTNQFFVTAAGAATATGITDSALTSGNCVQASTGGLLTTTGTPCGGLASTTTTVGTTAIGANTCTSATTVTMTGVATTSTFEFTPNADVSGVTGWGSTGGLTIDAWPTANTLNYKVCNQSAASITPSSSVTFNVSTR